MLHLEYGQRLFKRCALLTCCLINFPFYVCGSPIGSDKYTHAAVCYAIEYTLHDIKPFSKWKPWQRALFTTAVIGGGKELYDSRHPDRHSAEWGDIAADAVGAASAEGVVWLIHKEW